MTMILNDMFKKPIYREYEGVIKVGQHENENLKQELEEYVVTDELATHFNNFFKAYDKGLNSTTGKMGVWISGFFGSGKSHFLKMLSFLIENKEVDGKTAQEYFFEDDKITDVGVKSVLQKVADTSTDAILFNIDSKSESQGKRNKDAIVMVFLKVFNEMRGLAPNPFIADLESQLIDNGLFEKFKAKYQEINPKHEIWENSRHTFDFRTDVIVEALVAINAYSPESARTLCDRAVTGTYSISIEEFARRVKQYILSKGNDHHVVFLVDEIGQYIGENTELMLNLQTVVEDLGTACQGKAWVIVTSQEDIDSITHVKGEDFSKIQGRFDTRLALSSANADEVIKKRILSKNNVAEDTLRVIYSHKETSLKNLITFSGTALKKIYADVDDFVNVYPFVSYQFDLLGDVLTSIRTFGASGKHLSEGERSLLAMFKEAAIEYKNREEGTLIPLSAFYNAMENFLDHSHRSVISKAYDNEHLNPEHKKSGVFAIDVLKVLFMLKYIKNYQADLDTLVSLMVSNVDEDRIEIKACVEAALRKLKDEDLIQQNGSVYVFLTDEEQDINKMINKQIVEPSDIVKEVGDIVFNTFLTSKNYKYPKFSNRYIFPFSTFVDDQSLSANSNHPMSIRVLTSQSDVDRSEAGLSMLSMQENSIIVALPDDISFMEEIAMAKKINNFFQYDTSSRSLTNYDEIKSRKSREMREHNERAKTYLQEALKEADFYINGNKAEIKEKDFSKRIEDGLYRLVEALYSKLTYIDTAMNEVNVKKAITSKAGNLIDGETEANNNALQEVLRFITNNTQSYAKISIKSIKDRFKDVPYGFVDDDISYIVARLFKKGELAFSVNGEPVTIHSHESDDIFNFITKKSYQEKLMIECKERISDADKKKVRKLLKEVFDFTDNSEDEDVLMSSFLASCENKYDKLTGIKMNYGNDHSKYPGYQKINGFCILLQDLKKIKSTKNFYKTVIDKSECLRDFAEDVEAVETFFKPESNQKDIFDKAKSRVKIFEANKTYITDVETNNIAERIIKIVSNEKPYRMIKDLPQLNESFDNSYTAILDGHMDKALVEVEAYHQQVMNMLKGKSYKDQYQKKYNSAFEAIAEKARTNQNIINVIGCSGEASFLAEQYMNEMTALDARMAAQKKPETPPANNSTASGEPKKSENPPPAPKPVFTHRNVSLGRVLPARQYEIKSEADVDAMVEDLRKELKQMIKENTVYHVTL